MGRAEPEADPTERTSYIIRLVHLCIEVNDNAAGVKSSRLKRTD